MLPISHSTNALQPLAAQPTPTQAFLKTVKKIARLVSAVLLALAATGLFAIGVTMAPFAPEAGFGAIALSTALFGTAAYLYHKAR
jgi:hypothetical protein